jgi:hypothetical protein
MNLSTLLFRIKGVLVATTGTGEEIWTGQLCWSGESDQTIRQALERAGEREGDRATTREAEEWLVEYLPSNRGEPPRARRSSSRVGRPVIAGRLSTEPATRFAFVPRSAASHRPATGCSRRAPNRLSSLSRLTLSGPRTLSHLADRTSRLQLTHAAGAMPPSDSPRLSSRRSIWARESANSWRSSGETSCSTSAASRFAPSKRGQEEPEAPSGAAHAAGSRMATEAPGGSPDREGLARYGLRLR